MLKNLSTFVDIFSLVYISTLERRKKRLSQRIQLFYSAFAFLFSFPTLRKSQFLYRKRFSFWASTVFGNVQASAVCSEKFEKRKSHPLSPSHAQSCFTEKLSLSLHFRQLEPKVLLSRKNTQKNKHWKSYFTFVWQQQQRPRVWKLRKAIQSTVETIREKSTELFRPRRARSTRFTHPCLACGLFERTSLKFQIVDINFLTRRRSRVLRRIALKISLNISER